MKVKVWTEGVQRTVNGVTSSTTCQEIIYALAHATGRKGRFVLVEQWRSSERSLSPGDRLLESLEKWGVHAKNVRFVLRYLDDDKGNGRNSIGNGENIAENRQIAVRNCQNSIDLCTSLNKSFDELSFNSLRKIVRGRKSAENHNNSTVSNKTRPRSAASMRPPPPPYESVVENREKSRTLGHKMTEFDRYQWPSDRTELDKLIKIQLEKLDEQTSRMKILDDCILMNSPFDIHELDQLERQLDNLRLVLEPMRAKNWPKIEYFARLEQINLKKSIEMWNKDIERIERNLEEQYQLEAALMNELRQMEKVPNPGGYSEMRNIHEIKTNVSEKLPGVWV